MRSCIFCGNQASTKEDAWPLWLVRLLNKPSGKIEAVRGQQEIKVWQLNNPEIKVRYVCSACNNGWMSDLETRVKPIVEKLLHEDQVILNTMSQQILTTWSVKNAMVFETLRLNSSEFYIEVERRMLKENFQLPPITSIWVAKCINFESFFSKASDLKGIITGSNDTMKSYVTTMGFGSLAIQVLCSKLPNMSDQSLTVHADVSYEWDSATLRIWPIQDPQIIWPPSIGLSGESGLEAFSQRWVPIHK